MRMVAWATRVAMDPPRLLSKYCTQTVFDNFGFAFSAVLRVYFEPSTSAQDVGTSTVPSMICFGLRTLEFQVFVLLTCQNYISPLPWSPYPLSAIVLLQQLSRNLGFMWSHCLHMQWWVQSTLRWSKQSESSTMTIHDPCWLIWYPVSLYLSLGNQCTWSNMSKLLPASISEVHIRRTCCPLQ